MKLAILNAGSGSQRCSLFDLPPTLGNEPVEPIWEASLDSTAPGQPEGELRLKVRAHDVENDAGTLSSQATTAERTERLLHLLWEGPGAPIRHPREIETIGHRVVHGGTEFPTAVLIDKSVEAAIERLTALAPLHNPANRAGIEAVRKVLGPTLRQFAVFDTSFHESMSPAAFTYAGPYEWLAEGIRRYGFHGSSFRWAAERAARLLSRATEPDVRLVICHLGGGCSLCATRGGKSIDTTMGFTPLDGIAMCTRSGAIDPGILIYLQRKGWKADELEHLLNKESGLKGLAGLPGDTRLVLPRAAEGDEQAQLARDVFIHRLRAGIGQMLASLGKLPHALVFTDAIGESEPAIRRAACEAFGFLGLELDEGKNLASLPDSDLATLESRVRVLLVKSREAWQIAREVHALLANTR